MGQRDLALALAVTSGSMRARIGSTERGSSRLERVDLLVDDHLTVRIDLF